LTRPDCFNIFPRRGSFGASGTFNPFPRHLQAQEITRKKETNMGKTRKLGVFLLTICLVAVLVLALSATAGKTSGANSIQSADTPASLIFNRSLKSSTVSWGGCCQTANAGFTAIDSPLNFTCPGPGTCTLSAEMNVQAGGNTVAGNRWALQALVDGQYMDQPPAGPFAGELLTDGNYSTTTWIANQSGVTPGKHTLQSQIYVDDAATLANYSIVYRLYKP
jgi:hypothetical protein